MRFADDRIDAPDGWGGDVLVYLAGVSWQDVPGTDRRLVEKLADHIAVLWVDPPVSRFTRRADGPPTCQSVLRPVRRGVAQLTVVGPPGPARPGLRHISGWMERTAVRAAIGALGGRLVATVTSSPLPRSIRWAPRPRMYYATDDFIAGADLMGFPPRLLRRAEAENVRACNIVAGVTKSLTARLAGAGDRSLVLPNGCDVSAYDGVATAPRPPDVTLPDPIAGVVGQLSGRLDLDLLEAVADAGHSLLFVGPRHAMSDPARWERLLNRNQVQWVGARPFAELPAYLGAMTVGLTPYADTAFNRSSFPLKTLEYLAAGLPVVSSDLPATRMLASDLVAVGADPGEFARCVGMVLRSGHDPGRHAACRALAAEHDWSSRAVQVLEALGLRAPERPRRTTRQSPRPT